MVADEGTTFPFIVYRRTGLHPASTKDRYNYKEMASLNLTLAQMCFEADNEALSCCEEKLTECE